MLNNPSVIYIVKTFEKDSKKFLLMQLYTSCCKDRILFQKIGDGKYFNCLTMEECAEPYNKLIEQAIKNQDFLPKWMDQ